MEKMPAHLNAPHQRVVVIVLNVDVETSAQSPLCHAELFERDEHMASKIVVDGIRHACIAVAGIIAHFFTGLTHYLPFIYLSICLHLEINTRRYDGISYVRYIETF